MASTPEMEAAGLRPEDYAAAANAPSEVDIWPDNWAAVNAFVYLTTQWRVGMNGPTGLDYGAIEPTLRLTGVSADAWPQIFQDLRVLEGEALIVMAECLNNIL